MDRIDRKKYNEMFTRSEDVIAGAMNRPYDRNDFERQINSSPKRQMSRSDNDIRSNTNRNSAFGNLNTSNNQGLPLGSETDNIFSSQKGLHTSSPFKNSNDGGAFSMNKDTFADRQPHTSSQTSDNDDDENLFSYTPTRRSKERIEKAQKNRYTKTPKQTKSKDRSDDDDTFGDDDDEIDEFDFDAEDDDDDFIRDITPNQNSKKKSSPKQRNNEYDEDDDEPNTSSKSKKGIKGKVKDTKEKIEPMIKSLKDKVIISVIVFVFILITLVLLQYVIYTTTHLDEPYNHAENPFTKISNFIRGDK